MCRAHHLIHYSYMQTIILFMHEIKNFFDQDTSQGRYLSPGSHWQYGSLARGVIVQWRVLAQRAMHRELSWLNGSCKMRYPGPGSHAQWGSLARGVMHSEVAWPGESFYSEISCRSHAQWGCLADYRSNSTCLWL